MARWQVIKFRKVEIKLINNTLNSIGTGLNYEKKKNAIEMLMIAPDFNQTADTLWLIEKRQSHLQLAYRISFFHSLVASGCVCGVGRVRKNVVPFMRARLN